MPEAPAKSENPSPVVETWPTVLRLLRGFAPYPGRAAFALVLQIVRSAADLAVPLLIGLTIGSLHGHEGTGTLPASFRTHVLWMVAAIVLRAVMQYAAGVAAAALAQDVENDLRSALFAKVMRLRFRWHDENRAGKTIGRSLGDMEKAKGFFREVAFGYVEMALILVGVLILSFAIHWTYGLAASVLFGAVLVATSVVGGRIARLDREASDHYDHVTTALQENVAGAKVVRAFGWEPGEIERFGGKLGTYSTSWKTLERYWTTWLPIVHHGMVLVVPVALAVAVLRMAAEPGPETLAGALAVLLYLRTARERTRPLIRLVLLGQKSVSSATRVFEVLDRPDETTSPASPRALPDGGGRVDLEDVWFSYASTSAGTSSPPSTAEPARTHRISSGGLDATPGEPPPSLGASAAGADGEPAGTRRISSGGLDATPGVSAPSTGAGGVRGVSLSVPARGSLGVLGRTGAGKTTLVHLLPRFYDPDRGRVLLDGIDVRELEPSDLARAIALVFQEPFLFSATVHDNVAYGRPDATRAEVEEACRLAVAHEFVSALPKGYETLVGERGVSLSGGQRQRLTIARALLARPRVLVFDDATASVDAVTEKELFRGMRAAAAGRTAIVISQRVTSVRWCDRTAVMEEGRVTALGTHEELLASSALYREIFEHQALEAAVR